jgi:hypothetical protein
LPYLLKSSRCWKMIKSHKLGPRCSVSLIHNLFLSINSWYILNSLEIIPIFITVRWSRGALQLQIHIRISYSWNTAFNQSSAAAELNHHPWSWYALVISIFHPWIITHLENPITGIHIISSRNLNYLTQVFSSPCLRVFVVAVS